MAAVRNIPVTLQGTDISGQIAFSVGETVNLDLACLDPATLAPLDLTTLAVFFTLSCYTGKGVFSPISRQATNSSPFNAGLCVAPIVVGDTVVMTGSPPALDPIRPGTYRGDFWAEDAGGNRVDLGWGAIQIVKQERLPGAPVTVPPSQAPLAQGPPGVAFNYTYQTAAYAARFNDQVDADASGGGFNVTLPALSSLAAGRSGLTQIINGNLANAIGIVPAGSDKLYVPGTGLVTLLSIDPGVVRWLNPVPGSPRGAIWTVT